MYELNDIVYVVPVTGGHKDNRRTIVDYVVKRPDQTPLEVRRIKILNQIPKGTNVLLGQHYHSYEEGFLVRGSCILYVLDHSDPQRRAKGELKDCSLVIPPGIVHTFQSVNDFELIGLEPLVDYVDDAAVARGAEKSKQTIFRYELNPADF
ncbi:hypothetical protein EPN87_00935 [archaeon]|nr:MAG: hypothetical protein EPN87_00935 [archaeon]